MTDTQSVFIGLDIGEVRIGVAINPPGVSIARPLTTILNNDAVFESIQKIILEHNVTAIIVGDPRNLQGNDTDQTRYVAQFVNDLKAKTSLPIHMQDEALTSVKAEDELKARKQQYGKSDVDALAATYILQDYIEEHVKVHHA